MAIKMMVVDDSDDNLELIQLYVKSKDVEISTYINADDALNANHNFNDFDFIFIDQDMPGKKGTDLIKLIKEKLDADKTKIYLMSGYTDSGTRDLAIKSGAIDVYPKPVRKKEFLEFLGLEN